jgi:ribose/xylose/arabinose/galactoside ABC-type transport system permease subunit
MTRALANSGALIVLAVTYAVFSIAAPSFFGLQNLLDIVHVISPMIIVSTGMALVVMSGKLDISVGSIAYVASALFAVILRDGTLSLPAAVLVSTAAGLALGCINAVIVVGLRSTR